MQMHLNDFPCSTIAKMMVAKMTFQSIDYVGRPEHIKPRESLLVTFRQRLLLHLHSFMHHHHHQHHSMNIFRQHSMKEVLRKKEIF